MPNASYDTTVLTSLPSTPSQPDDWEQEVLPHLPTGWEQRARELGAFRRSRRVRNPGDLLRGVLASVLCVNSVRSLCRWSVLIGLADISEAAWRKHLSKVGAWLQWLLCELLAVRGCTTPWVLSKGLRRVLLLDGTHLRCPGKHGKIWRLHTAFDLLSGRLAEVLVTDTTGAENWNRFQVLAGDLLISDRINGYQERIGWVVQQLAHLIVRCSPSALPLYDRGGNRIEVLTWLKARHAPAGRICSRLLWVQTETLWIPVRLIGLRLTPEQQRKAERRVQKKAGQDKRKAIHPETLYVAGWLLVVTTLPQAQWSAAEVLTLYRSRWHIELLFKRFKQLLRVHRVRCVQMERVRSTLLAFLLAWALQEEQLSAVRLALQQVSVSLEQPIADLEAFSDESEDEQVMDEAEMPTDEQGQNGALSQWDLADLGVDLLRGQVRGRITRVRVQTCLPQLRRFLRTSPRRRTHWYSQVHRWLASPSPKVPSVLFLC